MDDKTKIIGGVVGCGCLVFAGAVVLSAALWFVADADDPEDQEDEVIAVTGEPRDAALGAYVNQASAAILAASRGVPHDARWNGGRPGSDLRGTAPEVRLQLAQLGPNPTVVMTVLELEATNGPSRVRGQGMVFPDGRVVWSRTQFDGISTNGMPTLRTAAPALANGIQRMLEALAGPCDLPVAGPADVSTLPPDVQRDLLRRVADIPAACAGVTTAEGWIPRVDDISVLVRGQNGQFLVLRSGFDLNGAGMMLYAVRARELR